MEKNNGKFSTALAGAGLLVACLVAPLKAGDGVVGHLAAAVRTTLDGAAATKGTTVLSGAQLVTALDGAAQLTTDTGDRVNFGPDTDAKVEREPNGTRLQLRRGRVAVRGSTTEVRLSCASVLSAPQTSSLWDVGVSDEKVGEVVAVEGAVQVRLPDQNIVLYRGERLMVNLDSTCSLRRYAQWPRAPGAGAGLSRPAEIALSLGGTAVVITGAVAASNAVHPDPVSPSGL